MHNQPKIGLVLGSGSSRGWAHIGVLKVLNEYQIPIEVISGCSVGAIMGAAYASNHLDYFLNLPEELAAGRLAKFFLPPFPKGGLISQESVIRFLKDHIPARTFEELAIPMAVPAVDLLSGQQVIFRNGDLIEALVSSSAIPGIFEPVPRNGQLLVDGGLLNPLPINLAKEMGADITIVVSLGRFVPGERISSKKYRRHEKRRKSAISNSSDSENRFSQVAALWSNDRVKKVRQSVRNFWSAEEETRLGIFEVINHTQYIMEMKYIQDAITKHKPDLVVRPQLPDFQLIDILRGDEGIAEGERVMRQAMPDLARVFLNRGLPEVGELIHEHLHELHPEHEIIWHR